MRDVIIVGGGIAGLAAAWSLRDLDAVVLEAESRFGGRVRSEPRGPYWLNFGAHLFPGEGSVINGFCKELGLETVPVNGSTMALALDGKWLTNDKLYTYPLLAPLGIKDRISLTRAGARLQLAAFRYRRLAAQRPGEPEYARRRRIIGFLDDKTLSALLGKLTPAVESIFRTAGHRVPGELEELSAGSGAGIFAEVWSGRKSTIGLNLIGGSSRLPEAMTAELGPRAVAGARVTDVKVTGDGVEAVYRIDGNVRTEKAHGVVIATTPDVAAHISRDLPSTLRLALASLRSAPFLSMAVLTNEFGPMPWDRIYAMATPGQPFDFFFNHAAPLRAQGARRPGGSIMVYAGARQAARLLDESDERITSAFLRGLYAIIPDLKGHIEEVAVQRWVYGNSYCAPGRRVIQDVLELPVGGGRIQLAGEYLGETGSMDTAARTGVEAAARIRRLLDGQIA